MPHLDWPALVQKKMTDDDLAQQLPQKLQALVEFVVQPWPPPKQESVPPDPPAQVNAGSVARYGIQMQSTKEKTAILCAMYGCAGEQYATYSHQQVKRCVHMKRT